MVLTTEFIKDDQDRIQLSEPVHGLIVSDRHFYFQTRTVISLPEDRKICVRSTRAMALGLLTYFLSNRPLQDLILKQNEAHAIDHFNTR